MPELTLTENERMLMTQIANLKTKVEELEFQFQILKQKVAYEYVRQEMRFARQIEGPGSL